MLWFGEASAASLTAAVPTVLSAGSGSVAGDHEVPEPERASPHSSLSALTNQPTARHAPDAGQDTAVTASGLPPGTLASAAGPTPERSLAGSGAAVALQVPFEELSSSPHCALVVSR